MAGHAVFLALSGLAIGLYAIDRHATRPLKRGEARRALRTTRGSPGRLSQLKSNGPISKFKNVVAGTLERSKGVSQMSADDAASLGMSKIAR